MARLLTRRAAACLALAILATACGDSKRDTSGVGPTATTTAESGSVTTTAATAAGTTRTTVRGSGSSATNVGGGTRDTTGRPDASTRNSIDAASQRSVGGFAGVVLAPGLADRLVLDVRSGGGGSASGDALSALADTLRSVSGKPVELRGPTALRGVGSGTHSADEIRKLAADQGSPNADGVAVLHLLYLGGQYETDGVLGVAVNGDTIAVFPDTVRSSTSPFVTEARLERAVTTHELGHVLGLVDIYLNENRDDPEHPGHSRNRGSVMYWAIETSLVGQVLGGPPPVDFDSDDLGDLKQIRSGAARA